MEIKYLSNHLKHRNLQLERYNHVSVDDENEVVTFPLWNLSGQMVGYQQYRPWGSKQKSNDPKQGRYFTYITPGQIGIWGLETFQYSPEVLFLTEGVFKACRIHNFELPAVAVLSNNPEFLRGWLRGIGRRVITIPDQDKAGMELVKFGHQSINLREGKPLDQVTDFEIKDQLMSIL